MRKLTQTLALLVLTLSLLLGGCAQPAPGPSGSQSGSTSTASETAASLDDIPAFSGEPYVVIDDNQPSFTASELTTSSFESYAPLDSLGRCGVAYACISTDLMPADGEKRGSISDVKPSGWITAKYDFVDGKYLYNRCHLIGWQLTAENANRSNLITGTRYMNTQGMLPFENWIDNCVDAGGRVLLRVEPVFADDELVARGVHMEALSLDDGGASVSFNVFCYNVQPGVGIDYATGDSWREQDAEANAEPAGTAAQSSDEQARSYVLNTNTRKFHLPRCRSVSRMKARNKQEVTMTRSEVMTQGYEPCAQCNP